MELTQIVLKKCPKCQIEKELCEENFAKDKTRKSGFYHTCKLCTKRYHDEHKLKPEVIAKNKAYYAEIRKDVVKVEKKRAYGRSDELKKRRRKQYHTVPGAKRKYKGRRLKRTYGITIEEYEKGLAEQNYSCAICETKHLENNNKPLHVDHCHTTGELRGLLCDLCNRGLGYLRDNTSILESAINYLNQYKTAI